LVVPETGLEPVLPCGKRILRRIDKGGESRTFGSYLDSSPFSLYEEYEECSTVRGLWTPRWTPVSLGIPDDRRRREPNPILPFSITCGDARL
jgi:hypothetical protein